MTAIRSVPICWFLTWIFVTDRFASTRFFCGLAPGQYRGGGPVHAKSMDMPLWLLAVQARQRQADSARADMRQGGSRWVRRTAMINSSPHLSLNREARWCTTDDFTTRFLYFSLFSTALWDLANFRPIQSLMISFHSSFCVPCLIPLLLFHVKSENTSIMSLDYVQKSKIVVYSL